ncbi:hypothetical protein [Botrimarina sp.]|uniref:hypothetical protein n=1 Tax=Botrimarina sp. TaxID=2795802 RepID=UPI0032ED597F
MSRLVCRYHPLLALSAALTAGVAVSETQSLRLPPEAGMLSIEATTPDETRVGERFKIELVVKNTSSQLTAHDIKIRVAADGPIEITRSQSGSSGSSSSSQSSRQQSNDQKSRSDGPQSERSSQVDSGQGDGSSDQDQSQQGQSQQGQR